MLLILAGVSIVTLTGDNGLLTRTTTAKQKTEVAGIQEELQTAIEALKIDYHTAGANGTIGTYISNHESDLKSAVGDSTLSVNGNKITYKGQQFTINDTTGKVTNSGVATVAKTWTQTGDSITDGEVTLKVGDYVNYNPMSNGATETTYTSYSSTNASNDKNSGRTSGYSSDQAFDAQKYVDAGYRWRVLDIKNGKIRLISEEPFGPGNFSEQNKTTYCLKGQQGFINGENELKAICSIFGHGEGAQSATSITMDDVLEITGYNPSNPKFRLGQWGAYGSTVTYTKEGENSLTVVSSEKDVNDNNLSYSYSSTAFDYFNGIEFVPLGEESIVVESSYFWHDFMAEPSSNHNVVDSNGMFIPKYELLFGKQKFDNSYNVDRNFNDGIKFYYWLASRYIDTCDIVLGYGVHRIGNDLVTYHQMYNVRGPYGQPSESDSWSYVRPIVLLNSRIDLEWNSLDNEWKIQ